MNKKVLKTMIALVIVFLVACYILKIFFPEQFVMVIQNENLVKIGTYVDNHLWLYILIAVVTNLLNYWLYLGATTHRWVLNWKQILAVCVVIAFTQGLYEVDAVLTSGLSIISMIIIPAIFGAKAKDIAIVFSFHYMSQLLSTIIRGLPMLLTSVNFMTGFLMTIEQYLWLLLFYLYYNMKKDNKNG